MKKFTKKRINRNKRRKTQKGGTIKEWCDYLGRCVGIQPAALPVLSAAATPIIEKPLPVLSPADIIRSRLLTDLNISKIYNSRKVPLNESKLAEMIFQKLSDAFPIKTRNHKIDAKKYDRVFITSDIHADLRKFVQMLTLNNLMSTTINPYDTANPNSIYDSNLIARSEWTGGSRTLLVIVGDLVDGKREFKKNVVRTTGGVEQSFPEYVVNSVDDPRGSFEFLLFALLFNLRLKANLVESEILFTIGNHEYDSIINPVPEIYTTYVTAEAKSFFGGQRPRKFTIMPFLRTSPYFMLNFYSDGVPEVACVHGGFHNNSTHLFGRIEQAQSEINNASEDRDFLQSTYEFEKAGLNTRTYAETPTGECTKVPESGFPLVVVGHCPTTFNSRPSTIISAGGHYEGCDFDEGDRDDSAKVGCVVLDCVGPDGGPSLAFVDTAMTKGYRRPTTSDTREIDNSTRYCQMLLLTHDPALRGPRYFNKIERVTRSGESGLASSGTVVWAAAPLPIAEVEAEVEVGAEEAPMLRQRKHNTNA